MLGYIVLLSIFNYFVQPTRIHSIPLNSVALFSLTHHLFPIPIRRLLSNIPVLVVVVFVALVIGIRFVENSC